MSAELLASVAGIVLSLAMSYVPGLSDWFGRQSPEIKRLIMLVLLLAVAAGVFGLSCAELASWVVCSKAGAWALVQLFVLAMVANQAAYQISKPGAAK